MAINRIVKNKNNPYTCVSNKIILDASLSAKAKGIMLYLISRPDDWEFYNNEIEKHFSDKKKSISSGLIELEKNGYLERKTSENTGRFDGMLWIIHEGGSAEIEPVRKSNQLEKGTGLKKEPVRKSNQLEKGTGLKKEPLGSAEKELPRKCRKEPLLNTNIKLSTDKLNTNKKTKEKKDSFGFKNKDEMESDKNNSIPKEFKEVVISHYKKLLKLEPKQTSRRKRLSTDSINDSAISLLKISKEFNYNSNTLQQMLDYSLTSDFWCDKTISLRYNYLTKEWANGSKIDCLYDDWKKNSKQKNKYHVQKNAKTEKERIDKYGSEHAVDEL